MILVACPSSRSGSSPEADSEVAREALKCETLAAEGCEAQPHCVLIRGSRYDVALQCHEPLMVLGCGPRSECVERETSALDMVGNCWIFDVGCATDGYDEVMSEMEPSACSALMLGWPPCLIEPDVSQADADVD